MTTPELGGGDTASASSTKALLQPRAVGGYPITHHAFAPIIAPPLRAVALEAVHQLNHNAPSCKRGTLWRQGRNACETSDRRFSGGRSERSPKGDAQGPLADAVTQGRPGNHACALTRAGALDKGLPIQGGRYVGPLLPRLREGARRRSRRRAGQQRAIRAA